MPRRRDPLSPEVVYRTARSGLRVTRAQRRRLLALLVSGGDVWAAVLELICPACQFTGHRDLTAAATIVARAGGGTTPAIPASVTHRRRPARRPRAA